METTQAKKMPGYDNTQMIPKSGNEKHVVYPGLGTDAKKLMKMLNTRQVKPKQSGQFTLDEMGSKIRGMNKIDIAREAAANKININKIKNNLNEKAKQSTKK